MGAEGAAGSPCLLAGLDPALRFSIPGQAPEPEQLAWACPPSQHPPTQCPARRELPQLQEECRQVLAAKQEVADSAKQLALGNAELLRRLQRRAGIAPGEAGGAEVEAAFLGALAEHEAKTRVQYAGGFCDGWLAE